MPPRHSLRKPRQSAFLGCAAIIAKCPLVTPVSCSTIVAMAMPAENLTAPFASVMPNLTEGDDRDLWQIALGVLADEFLQRYDEEAKNRQWVFIIGACSHWLRPHQTRWTASGGFAAPRGYNSFRPQLDWSVMFSVCNRLWMPIERFSGSALTSFTAAMPSRTARHKQAAIHTKWSTSPKAVYYGFRNLNGRWKCVAASDEKSRGSISLT